MSCHFCALYIYNLYSVLSTVEANQLSLFVENRAFQIRIVTYVQQVWKHVTQFWLQSLLWNLASMLADPICISHVTKLIPLLNPTDGLDIMCQSLGIGNAFPFFYSTNPAPVWMRTIIRRKYRNSFPLGVFTQSGEETLLAFPSQMLWNYNVQYNNE